MDDLIRQRVRELAAHAEEFLHKGPPREPGIFRVLFTGAAKTPDPNDTVRSTINALIELHQSVEIGSPASLPQFRDALPPALALLAHQHDGIRMQSLELIGVIKADRRLSSRV